MSIQEIDNSIAAELEILQGFMAESDKLESDIEDLTEKLRSQSTSKLTAMIPARLRVFSAQNAMADQLGVPVSWLAPLRDWIDEVQKKTADATLTDDELQRYLDEAIARMPELFGSMDTESLAQVLEVGMGQAVIAGVKDGLSAKS